jgi:SagB-type dehydrogenase family enzyme
MGDDSCLATLVPASPNFTFAPKQAGSRQQYVLSRFAYCRREKNRMVLESPLAHGKIELKNWMASAIMTELSKAVTITGLSETFTNISEGRISLFVSLLLSAGFITEIKQDQTYPDGDEVLAQWEFHDLLFHSRSRLGRQTNKFGGTYRFHNKIDPLPAIKPQMSEDVIDLFRPDLDQLEQDDHPFTMVLEHRQSIREYADQPLTDKQLGEFLYRTARVKKLIHNDIQDLSQRPYPGGGAIYELELYLTINECVNMPPGLYHYEPLNHQLYKISDLNRYTENLFKDAAGSAGMEKNPPQVLITITARFQRLSWKYESMAYNVILKNVGVLYQTMYLVATAMELSPCALGGGDSDLFAKTAGLIYYEETSVGEFLLGSKRI